MTQKENVLNHLKVYKSITPLEALNRYGSLRLGAIIYELKKEGYTIQAQRNRTGKPYAIYTMD